MLLWSLNVLQDTSVTGTSASEVTREHRIGTPQLGWEVFSPGNIDQVVQRMAQRPEVWATRPTSI